MYTLCDLRAFVSCLIVCWSCMCYESRADPGLQARGSNLKKLRRAEGGANIFGVFRVKNHDLTPKNHIFSNCGGRRENCWGISCEKSRF
jgi:hypothetical protein